MEQTKAETNNKENQTDKEKDYMSKWGAFFKIISAIILVLFLLSIGLIIENQVRMSKNFADISLETAKETAVAVSSDGDNGCNCSKKESSDNKKEEAGEVASDSESVEGATELSCECNNIVKNDDIKSDIDYIKELQEVQKEATASDITSLIYSIVITIVTALGLGLVAEILKKAKEAKEKAEEAKDFRNKAKESAYEAEKSAENAKVAYEASEHIARLSEVLRILITISDARLALSLKKKAEATDRITEIERLTKTIYEANEKRIITQLQDELLRLDSSVDDYEGYIKDCNTSQERKDNDLVAVKRFRKQINSAVKHCDRLIEEAEKAERFKAE